MKIIFFLSAFFFKLINLDFSAFAETLDQMDEHFKNLLENKSRNDSNIREEITKDVNKYLNEEYRKRYPREEDKFTKFFKSTENILNKKIYFDNLTVGSVLKMVSFMILVDKVFFFTVDTIYWKALGTGFDKGVIETAIEWSGNSILPYDESDENIAKVKQDFLNKENSENIKTKNSLMSNPHLLFMAGYFTIIIIQKIIGL